MCLCVPGPVGRLHSAPRLDPADTVRDRDRDLFGRREITLFTGGNDPPVPEKCPLSIENAIIGGCLLAPPGVQTVPEAVLSFLVFRRVYFNFCWSCSPDPVRPDPDDRRGGPLPLRGDSDQQELRRPPGGTRHICSRRRRRRRLIRLEKINSKSGSCVTFDPGVLASP